MLEHAGLSSRRADRQRLGEALRGRDAVGDGELYRLAHGIARELATEPQRAKPAPKRDESVRGFGAVP